ncbi:major facilitator family transporter [Sulfurifustis variabilis]|uniref:Major facilitator family transporter n=1 Tax=Sulfurifustis variabilis TaxID=1675686 RepID=A0A1B4V965_9GAMM|nr:MFS transporter [Sulfurifustis variabilis]BAU50079.1 major facilitator family transporter [Sulfurifustis variabilis]
MTAKIPAWRAVWLALRSWRTAAVSLLSFSSGLPLGLVWIAIPTWLAREGVDIKIIGLFTLAQAPWSFKFLWSPLMDRYALPIPKLGRKLGWTLAMQVALLALTFVLGDVARHPDAIWIVGSLTLAIAFASASQDIAIDAYAVEVLRPNEQGVAVGARIAIYRAAMFVAGGLAITLAGMWSWPFVFTLIALLYAPMLFVTLFAPRSEADRLHAPPSLRAAVWEPFVGFLAKARALELLGFVVLYKLADNLAGALVRPFLVQVGFDDFDVGVATATIGLVATLVGTFLGGVLTTAMGLGHALWVFGGLQIASNLGYVLIAMVGVDRPLMYAAMGFESITTGMGTGAFSVLLLRMTMKQFSATQYALFSSLFALPRILAGPVTGVMVDAMGWRDFFLFTIAIGIPGLLMLHRFSPLGVRDPELEALADIRPRILTRGDLVRRGALGGLVALVIGAFSVAALDAFKRMRALPDAGFDLIAPLTHLLVPTTVSDWLSAVGVLLFGFTIALATAATAAARSKKVEGKSKF